MNEKEKLAKVKKSCNIAHIVSKVLMIILFVASVITLGVGIYLLCNQEKVNASIITQMEEHPGMTVTVDDVRIGNGLFYWKLDTDKLLAQGEYALAIGETLIAVFILCLITAVIFMNIVTIFKFLKNSETPFAEEVLKKLKSVFIKLLIICIIFIGGIETLMVGMLLWCIYCILDYGFVLQQEVDETL